VTSIEVGAPKARKNKAQGGSASEASSETLGSDGRNLEPCKGGTFMYRPYSIMPACGVPNIKGTSSFLQNISDFGYVIVIVRHGHRLRIPVP
jgi:hypothetical protein